MSTGTGVAAGVPFSPPRPTAPARPPTPPAADIALWSEMVAVEVDGSAHWTQNEPYAPLGRTIWRWRVLASRGWRVVSVPYFRWARLESLAAKKQYLYQLLQVGGCWVAAGWVGGCVCACVCAPVCVRLQ